LFSVVIKGKFTTGTTQDDEEEAKKMALDFLLWKLREAGIIANPGEPSGPFEWVLESVEMDSL